MVVTKFHFKPSNLHGQVSGIAESHTLQLSKTITIQDLVVYSQCFLEFEPYSLMDEKERLKRLKEIAKKVAYSGIYESLDHLVPGSIFNPITLEFEYIRTRSKLNRLEQHHYLHGKQISDVDAEISQDFLKLIAESVADLTEWEKDSKSPAMSFGPASEMELSQFREILELIYQKFHYGDYFQAFTMENLQFALPPETSAKFSTLVEKLSLENITEIVKMLLKGQSPKKLEIFAPSNQANERMTLDQILD